MDALQRRTQVLKKIQSKKDAISARELAKIFSVSRQIIVGDVALLRAEGHEIVAGAKGYIYGDQYPNKLKKIVAVQHTQDQTYDELHLFVSLGVIIEDVIVEHPIYGELKGNLNIKTEEDILDFLKNDSQLLSSLTEGIHLHTIIVEDEAHFKTVLDALQKNQFSLTNHEVS